MGELTVLVVYVAIAAVSFVANLALRRHVEARFQRRTLTWRVTRDGELIGYLKVEGNVTPEQAERIRRAAAQGLNAEIEP